VRVYHLIVCQIRYSTSLDLTRCEYVAHAADIDYFNDSKGIYNIGNHGRNRRARCGLCAKDGNYY
jgi:hypothetical protein